METNMAITDRLRTLVGEALASNRFDHVVPVRKAREALATVNDLAGRPFCTATELSERTAAEVKRAADLREPAPVIVYFDGKDHRTKVKVEELLSSRSIAFRVLDVSEDEATRSFAETASKAKEFPLVFIAGNAVGGLHELMQLDVNGELARRVFGA
ncbi:MAG: glutaredoxin domain-containing protein [Polyangia bacterium]